MTDYQQSRRKFIITGAAAASGAAFGYHSLSAMEMPVFTKDDPVRVGLIGSGRRGTGLAHVLKTLPGLELVACCDVLPEHLQNGLKVAPEAKGYKDYRKLLEDKNIDAVIIASPLYLHYQMAMDALSAGKDIYLEKTMTYDISQALEFAKKVTDSDRVVQIGHQYRYYDIYYQVKNIISKGWAGDIMHYECQYHSNHDWRRPVSDPKLEKQINWRMYREYSGGLMAELCAHQIDIVNWMTDSHPLKVTGFGGIDYWQDGRETYDNVRTIFEYPGGVKSSVSSILSNAYKGYSIRVLGTKATIEILRNQAFMYAEPQEVERGVVDGVSGATIQAWTQGEAVPIEFEAPEGGDPTSSALLSFAECVKNRKQPVCNVETGLNAAVSVHLGNKAMREEKVQHWKPEYSV